MHTHTHTKNPYKYKWCLIWSTQEGQTCPFSITALCVFVSRWLFPCCSPGAVYLAGSMLWGPGSRTLLDRGCRSLVRFSNDCCPGCHAGKSPEWHNIKVLWDFLFLLFLFVHPQARIIDCQTVITSPRIQLHVSQIWRRKSSATWSERERDDLSVCSAGKRN